MVSLCLFKQGLVNKRLSASYLLAFSCSALSEYLKIRRLRSSRQSELSMAAPL